MVVKLEVIKSNRFIKAYGALYKSIRIKIDKLLIKIINNPEIGKPMRHARKGTREVYINPFRLSYSYNEKSKIIEFLDLYHKDKQ